MRLDDRDGYHERLQALKMSEDYTSILGVKHTGSSKENPHYHLVIQTQVKDKAFRARMVKVFDKGKGNGHMSIVPWNGADEAYSYMFHEGAKTPDIKHNITDERISHFMTMNSQVQVLVKEAKKKATFLLESEVLQFLNKDSDEFEIAKQLVTLALRTGKYLPSDYQLRQMVDKVQFRLQEGDIARESQIIDHIVRRALII